jgi:hypothetical protein
MPPIEQRPTCLAGLLFCTCPGGQREEGQWPVDRVSGEEGPTTLRGSRRYLAAEKVKRERFQARYGTAEALTQNLVLTQALSARFCVQNDQLRSFGKTGAQDDENFPAQVNPLFFRARYTEKAILRIKIVLTRVYGHCINIQ